MKPEITSTGGEIHVMLVSFPGQGHINPMLRLGRLLAAKKGLVVTLTTTTHAKTLFIDRSISDSDSDSIKFNVFDDGFVSEEERFRDGIGSYLPRLEMAGKKCLPELISAQKSPPVSCMVSNPFIPWAADVAAEMGIPCAVLWVQSCALFSCYYHFHNKTLPFFCPGDTGVALPGLPELRHDEVPTFLNPKSGLTCLGDAILGQFQNLHKVFCVLADTFEELETEALASMAGLCKVRPVGPLFMRASTTEEDTEGCLEWLDGRAKGSVVYISFGTIVQLSPKETEEIAQGVLSSGVDFLWVARPMRTSLPQGFLEMAGKRGKVVKWAPQEAVLTHPSVACFLTHCGWNSSVEALASGVPVVAWPQWGDQVTNAKFLVDVFGIGLRLGRGEIDGHVVGRDEVAKCLTEATSASTSAEIRRNNAAKWKTVAAAAVADGGSSDRNLADFVDEIRRRSCGAGGKCI